ncbi:MAG: hypothetical protein JNL70_28195 [Saprospiraceae bacterium]|nr:hypothetical protein [Saprospiraceae bacterium]
MANITDKDEPVEETHSDKRNLIAWIILCVLIALGILSGVYHRWVKKNTKVYKGVLIEKYGVHKKTFAKWMRWIYFQDENKFQEYTKKKKLSQFEIEEIINFFGEPTPTMSILTKGKIIGDRDGTYETLRSTVLHFSDKIGLSIEAYDAIDVFPPLIAQRILKHY